MTFRLTINWQLGTHPSTQKKYISDRKPFYERCVNVLKRLTTLKNHYTYVLFNDNLFLSRKSTHCGLVFDDERKKNGTSS